jgi:hypothetical protein
MYPGVVCVFGKTDPVFGNARIVAGERTQVCAQMTDPWGILYTLSYAEFIASSSHTYK